MGSRRAFLIFFDNCIKVNKPPIGIERRVRLLKNAEDRLMKRLMCEIGLTLLVILTLIMTIRGVWPPASQSRGEAQNQPQTNPEPSVSVRDESYKLIVGANPSIGQQQTFLPPTNSVVITNGEVQLQALIEKAKKSHQKTVQQ